MKYDEFTAYLKSLSNPLILYCAGEKGRRCKLALEWLGKPAACFVESNPITQDAHGLQVLSFEEAKLNYPDAIWFVCTAVPSAIGDIQAKLQGQQICEIDYLLYIYHKHVLGRNALAERYEIGSGPKDEHYLCVPPMNFIVTDHCTLKCRDCIHFSPYGKNIRHYPPEELVSSLEKLAQTVDVLERIAVSGGEALLHPQLPQILQRIRAIPNLREISLFTNGTIVPKKETLAALRSNIDYVLISNYGKLSTKIPELIAALDEYHIPYELTPPDFSWRRIEFPPEEPHSEERADEMYYYCKHDSFASKALVNGRFLHCTYAFITQATEMLPFSDDSSLDIMNTSLSGQELRERIFDLTYPKKRPDICRYCGFYFGEEVEPAIQL